MLVSFIALLRAVNVGGTGALPMTALKAICEAVGLQSVRTYIASGNVVFRSEADERQVKTALEEGLLAYAGKPVGVVIRTAREMAEVSACNPFPDAPANRVMAIFLDQVALPAMLYDVVGRAEDEALRLGNREIYVHYGAGMGASKLRIPAAKQGTARNMKTVTKLAEIAATC